MKFNVKNLAVLQAVVAGATSAAAVIEKLNDEAWGAKQVAGALRNLRNVGMISGDIDGFRVLKAAERGLAAATAEASAPAGGNQAIKTKPVATATPKAHNKRSKRAKALTLFQRHNDRGGRAKVIAAFQSQLDMTEGGASTYYQLCRKELGMTGRATQAA